MRFSKFRRDIQVPEDGNVTIQLIDELSDPEQCFEAAEKKDTATTEVYVYRWNGDEVNAPPIFGSFEGAEQSDLNTIFTIKIPLPSDTSRIVFPSSCGDVNNIPKDIQAISIYDMMGQLVSNQIYSNNNN